MDIFGGRIMENFFENLLSNGELQKENERLKSCLQEIKIIAEKEIYMKQNSSMNKILDLITKAESEG